jgi:hypothetical protein
LDVGSETVFRGLVEVVVLRDQFFELRGFRGRVSVESSLLSVTRGRGERCKTHLTLNIRNLLLGELILIQRDFGDLQEPQEAQFTR